MASLYRKTVTLAVRRVLNSTGRDRFGRSVAASLQVRRLLPSCSGRAFLSHILIFPSVSLFPVPASWRSYEINSLVASGFLVLLLVDLCVPRGTETPSPKFHLLVSLKMELLVPEPVWLSWATVPVITQNSFPTAAISHTSLLPNVRRFLESNSRT